MDAAIPLPSSADLPRRTLTVDEYHRMGEAGILREDDRVELIEGELIRMAPIGSLHMKTVNRLAQALFAASDQQFIVSVQNPLVLPPHSELQPDVALLKPEADRRSDLPTAEDALLLVEVADSTLARDRDVKIPLYARHGVPEVWLVNLQRQVVHVFRDPGPEGYREMFERGAATRLAPVALPRAEIELAALFR